MSNQTSQTKPATAAAVHLTREQAQLVWAALDYLEEREYAIEMDCDTPKAQRLTAMKEAIEAAHDSLN